MSIRVYIHGAVKAPEEACISIFDRGFLFGDSIYETMAVLGRRAIFLAEHLDRLERSAKRTYLELPSRQDIERAIRSTVEAFEHPDCRLRVIVTRGSGPIDIDPATAKSPEVIVIAQPLSAPSAAAMESGVAVEIVGLSRGSAGSVGPEVKSGNYLGSVLAISEARRRDPAAHEAILCTPEGSVAEGATSNVFAVKAGTLRTPALEVGILEGVTRDKVLWLARRAGIPTEEPAFFPADDLKAADEVFLTSAVRGILPVRAVDGSAVGTGQPGPVTRKLVSLYRQLVNEAP